MDTSRTNAAPTLSSPIGQRIGNGTEDDLRDRVDPKRQAEPDTSVPLPRSAALRFVERLAKRWGQPRLFELIKHGGEVQAAFQDLPGKMHQVARQTELVMELVDDFREGRYREIPWRTVAVAAGVLLYAASPADVVPDVLPGLGQLDDIAVLALGLRLIRKDLRAYCEFKGYDPQEFFGEA